MSDAKRWRSGAWRAAAIVLVWLAPAAGTESVLSRISVRNPNLPGHFYSEVHRFPETVRDYSAATLFGYSFRQELPGGAVREIQVSRVHTPAPI